ncbi:membrane protein [Sulfuriferula plumbiphila]|uniref:Membrane protein n=1 Tax=Sulfuriferula plumbiphila TaxID=171865 RepID=A0A512L7Q2_9PROT|nr:DUF4149 domain-containing protein [Sulfuriferula plumbiphila]BBP03968.1 membrane protein [Sulfuriferula plumbiphila]GEP30515.1 membrane protein [Sulfuriferula plumbiphila]
MKNLPDALARIAVTLWVGGIWAIGYITAPVLFSSLADKQLAGNLAGHMFTVMAYVSMVCGFYLIIQRLAAFGSSAPKQAFFWVALVMLLLTLGGHFGIQPIMENLKERAMPQAVMESIFRDRFARWHGISSIVYLVQSLLGLVLILKQNSR